MKLLLNFDYLLKIYFPELIGKFKVDYNFLNLFNEENRPVLKNKTLLTIRKTSSFLKPKVNETSLKKFNSYNAIYLTKRQRPMIKFDQFPNKLLNESSIFVNKNKRKPSDNHSKTLSIDQQIVHLEEKYLEIKLIEYIEHQHNDLDDFSQDTIYRLSEFTINNDLLVNNIIEQQILIPRDVVDSIDYLSDEQLRYILEELLRKNQINLQMIIRNSSNKNCREDDDQEEDEIEEIERQIEKEVIKITSNEVNDTIILNPDSSKIHYKFEDDFNQLGKVCNDHNSNSDPANIGLNTFKPIKINYERYRNNTNTTYFYNGGDYGINDEENTFENLDIEDKHFLNRYPNVSISNQNITNRSIYENSTKFVNKSGKLTLFSKIVSNLFTTKIILIISIE